MTLTENDCIRVGDAADKVLNYMRNAGCFDGDDAAFIHTIGAVIRDSMYTLIVETVDPNSKPLDNDGST